MRSRGVVTRGRALPGALVAALLAVAGCSGPAFKPIDPRAQNSRAGALAWWYGPDTAELDAGERPVVWLLDQKCAVRKMGPARSAFFASAAGHANRAIRSPAFAAIVKARDTWQLTPDSGAQIMDRLRWAGVQINVFTYARDGAHPCYVDEVVDGRTTAFTPMPGNSDVHLLFLHEPYFVEEMQKSGVRDVARTIVHEAMHSMGYQHRDLEVGAEPYNNTVPPYIGCMIEHWGGPAHQAWIKDNCHKADAARARAPG